MNIGIIIQARSTSTRLPQKVILPFFEKDTIIDIIIKKLQQVNLPIVLATTSNDADTPIANIGQALGVNIYRGDEHDVLSRFAEVAEQYDFDYVIRVCADNPFISLKWLRKMIAAVQNKEFDYFSFSYGDKPVILTHFGIFAEMVKATAFRKIEQHTADMFYKEHVTNYLYQHPDIFDVLLSDIKDAVNWDENMRLTIDTANDWEVAKTIYHSLYRKYGNEFDSEEIVLYLQKHPIYLEQMAREIELNQK